MTTTTELSHSVLSSIPLSVRDTYPLFVEFMQEYYKWLYEISPVSLIPQTDEWLKNISDDPEYITRTMLEMGYDFQTISVSKNLFFDRLQEFTNIRGTEESFHLMFRLLYGVNIELTYPRNELFYTSNTNTVLVKRLMCKVEDSVELADKYYSIKGLQSEAIGTVEQFSVLYVGSDVYLLVDISNYSQQEWILGEALYIYSATGKNTLSNTGMYVLNVESSGNYYKVGDRIVVNGCNINGIITVDSLTSGNIPTISITDGGVDYVVGDSFTTTPNGGFYAKVTEVDSSGTILAVWVTNKGFGYKELPEVVQHSKTGTGAIISLIPSNISGIRNLKYILPYSICSSPTVDITTTNGNGFIGSFSVVNQLKTQIRADQISILGVNSTIQNSDGFHEFSYTISSPLKTDIYMSDLKKYIHPSGFQVVGTTPVTMTNIIEELITTSTIIIQE